MWAKALVLACAALRAAYAQDYSMYVWNDMFNADPSISCAGVYRSKSTHPECFFPAWQNAERRANLWQACTRPGRKITRIFLSHVKTMLEDAKAGGYCDGVLYDTLCEARSHGIDVFALFAVSDADFSEKDMVYLAHEHNGLCGSKSCPGVASGAAPAFAGVAINNEHFTNIKCSGDDEVRAVLDDLWYARDKAAPLPLHFSIGWHWSVCDSVDKPVEWGPPGTPNASKLPTHHMIDIATSVDVQVAWNEPSTMVSRAETAGYSYWLNNHAAAKQFYVLAYLNPTSDCRLSFAPHTEVSSLPADYTCATGVRTQAGMEAAFDHIENTLQGARGGLHYYGGVYATGMSDDWPRHVAPPSSPSPSPPPSNKKRKCSSGPLWRWVTKERCREVFLDRTIDHASDAWCHFLGLVDVKSADCDERRRRLAASEE